MNDDTNRQDQTPAPTPTDAESVVARFEGRLDEVAQRFDRTDWVELVAAIILALATIVAAWSAYQSARWGGEQAKATAAANADRLSATQLISLAGVAADQDYQVFIGWLGQAVEGDQQGMAEFESRVSDGLRPAFDAWLATAAEGEIPPGSPIDRDEYDEDAIPGLNEALDAIASAEDWSDRSAEANQTSDNFVLIAVVMASVLFFAGVGSKFRGRRTRIAMVALAGVVFVVGLGFMVNLPQNVGI